MNFLFISRSNPSILKQILNEGCAIACKVSNARSASSLASNGCFKHVGKQSASDLSASAGVNFCQSRGTTTSFFTKLTADDLWKSTTSVSKAGARRGRGKGAGRKTIKDLNRGQQVGVGRVNMVFPGLNTPIIRGREKIEMRKLPPNEEYLANLIKQRNEMDIYKKRIIHPLERGWSGKSISGRSLGPPDPVHGEQFEGFVSKVLKMEHRLVMTASRGKVRMTTVLAITGNKNGCAGYAVGTGKDARVAMRNAINKAGQRLRYFNVHDGHTITHDFYSRFGAYKVFAFKKPPGYGVVAHRALGALCDVIGIKDLYVKVQGPIKKRNYLDCVRAFVSGLANQKTYQELADEKKMHVVEFSEDRDFLPTIVASPRDGVRTNAEIRADEVLDFRMHLFDGRVKEPRMAKLPRYTRGDGYAKYLQKYHYLRPRQMVRVYLKATYGTVDGFLNVREKQERARRALLLGKPEETEIAASAEN